MNSAKKGPLDKADKSLKNQNTMNLFLNAVAGLDDEFITKGVSEGGIYPNVTMEGVTLLQLAAINKCPNIVKCVLSQPGVEVDLATETQPPALILVIDRGDEEEGIEQIVKDLLKKRADPNVVDTEGVTPLQRAAEKKYGRIARALLEAGANPEIPDVRNWSATWVTEQKGYEKMKKVFDDFKKSKEPKVEAPDPVKTPEQIFDELKNSLQREMAAVAKAPTGSQVADLAKLIQTIEKNNFDVNSATSQGFTPLHFAAQFGEAVDVEKLLARGANSNVLADGKSALQIAVTRKNIGLMQNILDDSRLEVGQIVAVIPTAISVAAGDVLNRIFAHEKVTDFFTPEEGKKAKNPFDSWRSEAKKIKSPTDCEKVKKSINGFADKIQTLVKQRDQQPRKKPVKKSVGEIIVAQAEQSVEEIVQEISAVEIVAEPAQESEEVVEQNAPVAREKSDDDDLFKLINSELQDLQKNAELERKSKEQESKNRTVNSDLSPVAKPFVPQASKLSPVQKQKTNSNSI